MPDRKLLPFPKSALPVVLQYRPTQYEVVEGERLKEWESRVADRLGVELRTGRRMPTLSFCGPFDPNPDPNNACDEDAI